MRPLASPQVFPRLKPCSAAAKEVIIKKGEQSRDLFFLLKGEVDVMTPTEAQVMYRIVPGDYFGGSVLTGRRRDLTYTAHSFCDMYSLDRDDLEYIFSKHPIACRKVYTEVFNESNRKQKLRALFLRFVISSLPRGSTRAALTIQLAWQTFTNSFIDQENPFAMAAARVELGRRGSTRPSASYEFSAPPAPAARPVTRVAAHVPAHVPPAPLPAPGGSTDPAQMLVRMEALLAQLERAAAGLGHGGQRS